MPKYDELYPRKEPHLQMKILKSIGLRGRLSQREAAENYFVINKVLKFRAGPFL